MIHILLGLYFIGAAYTTDYNVMQATGKHALVYWGEQRAAAEREMGIYQDAYGQWQFRVNEQALEEERARLALAQIRRGQLVTAYGLVGIYEGRAQGGMATVRFPEGPAKVKAADIKIMGGTR